MKNLVEVVPDKISGIR